MTGRKLRLVGSGSKEGRFFFVLEKAESFISLFPRFLLGCGFRNLGVYEDYQEEMPDINRFINKVEHFKNSAYDVDVIYTQDKIVLIIRTSEANKEQLINGIEKMAVP